MGHGDGRRGCVVGCWLLVHIYYYQQREREKVRELDLRDLRLGFVMVFMGG